MFFTHLCEGSWNWTILNIAKVTSINYNAFTKFDYAVYYIQGDSIKFYDLLCYFDMILPLLLWHDGSYICYEI